MPHAAERLDRGFEPSHDHAELENSVLQESIKGRRTDADSFAWDVPVPANGEATLKVTLRQSW